MSLIFKIEGALPEHAIRTIVREAETQMAPGADAKAVLVTTALAYLTQEFAFTVYDAIVEVQEMAESIGTDPDFAPLGIGDVAASLLSHNGDVNAAAMAFARAAVEEKPVLPMNRGKWLAKLGIVKAHIAALGSPGAPRPPTTPEAIAAVGAPPEVSRAPQPIPTIMGAEAIEAPDVTDPEMREMLGYAPLPAAEVPAAPLAGAAHSAAAPPTAPAPDASSAAPGSPPPPPTGTPRDAFMLFATACDIQDAELAKRLAISRSTVHNYLGGRTTRVKCDLAQARVMAAECDRRVALLRQAAEIFSQVRD